jgi:hypothetical protein
VRRGIIRTSRARLLFPRSATRLPRTLPAQSWARAHGSRDDPTTLRDRALPAGVLSGPL